MSLRKTEMAHLLAPSHDQKMGEPYLEAGLLQNTAAVNRRQRSSTGHFFPGQGQTTVGHPSVRRSGEVLDSYEPSLHDGAFSYQKLGPAKQTLDVETSGRERARGASFMKEADSLSGSRTTHTNAHRPHLPTEESADLGMISTGQRFAPRSRSITEVLVQSRFVALLVGISGLGVVIFGGICAGCSFTLTDTSSRQCTELIETHHAVPCFVVLTVWGAFAIMYALGRSRYERGRD